MSSVVALEKLRDVMAEHDPADIDGWGNIECRCGVMFYEDIERPRADAEHRVHVAVKLQEAFQEGRLFSPEFHEVWNGILEEYRTRLRPTDTGIG